MEVSKIFLINKVYESLKKVFSLNEKKKDFSMHSLSLFNLDAKVFYVYATSPIYLNFALRTEMIYVPESVNFF